MVIRCSCSAQRATWRGQRWLLMTNPWKRGVPRYVRSKYFTTPRICGLGKVYWKAGKGIYPLTIPNITHWILSETMPHDEPFYSSSQQTWSLHVSLVDVNKLFTLFFRNDQQGCVRCIQFRWLTAESSWPVYLWVRYENWDNSTQKNGFMPSNDALNQ